MHILIVASYYPTEANPVTGIFIEKQALMLRKAGHQVGVLVTPRLSATREEMRRSGIGGMRAVTHEIHFSYGADLPVYRMHWGWFPRPLPPVVTVLTRMAGIPAYQHYVKHHGLPDVLYAHDTFYGGYLAAEIGKQFHVSVVTLEHSTSYLEGKIIFPMQPSIIRNTLRSVQRPFAVGHALAGALMRYAPDVEVGVLGNIIDTNVFVPSDVEVPRSPFQFTIIASLKERRKGFNLLVDALAALVKEGSDARLTVGGDGPLRAEIAAHAEQLGVTSHVEFTGRLTIEGVRDLIHRSHAVVCASHVETFNVTLAEAMACGVPVLSTRCGGPEDYLTPNTGILVEPGSSAALADGMRRMITEYERFDRAEARRQIVERYSDTALTAKLEAAFIQATAQSKD